MTEWHCFKCKEKMVETEFTMNCLDIEGKAEGLQCPHCGAKYIPEEFVINNMLKAEKMIEKK